MMTTAYALGLLLALPAGAQQQNSASYAVYFEWNQPTLSPEQESAHQIITMAADKVKERGSKRVVVIGYTDTSLPENRSLDLSKQMAASVAQELAADGVPAAKIQYSGMGWRDPALNTGPGVREPQNRRVVILIE